MAAKSQKNSKFWQENRLSSFHLS